MRSGFLGFAIVAMALASSTAAHARDSVAAEALFRAGRAAMTQGEYATACAKFAESQRLDPATGTLVNLGECSEHLGLFATAWGHYHAALDRLPAGDARIDLVKARLADLEPRLSRLTIALAPGAPHDARVSRDGETLGDASLGVALPVDKGSHRVVASSPGRAPRETTITLDVGESKTIAVEPGAPLAAAASSSGVRAAGFVVGVLGLGSLGAGIATGVMTMQRKSTVDGNCTDQVCNSTGVIAASQGKTLSLVSTVTFVAGLAGIAAGTAMIVVGSRAQAPATAIVIAPTFAPGSGGVVAHVRF